MEERTKEWFELESITHYQIFDKANVKRGVGEFDTIEEAISQFKKHHTALEEGKYRIKGMKRAKADRAAVFHDFTKDEFNNMGMLGGQTLEQIKQEAYERGQRDEQFNSMRREIDTLKENFKKLVVIIDEKFDELDGNKDNDIFGKVTEAVEKAGSISDLMDGFGKN